MNILKNRLYVCAKKLYKPIKIFRFGFGIFDITKEKSYYPEKGRKSYFKRLNENFRWLIRYGTPNEFYNLYGFDIVGSDKKEFD